MMKTLIKIMVFSIFINLATGILLGAFNVAGEEPIFNLTTGNTMALDFNEDVMAGVPQTLNGTTSLGPIAEDSDTRGFIFEFLLNNALVQKLQAFMDKYLYSFIIILGQILKLPPAMISLFKWILTIGYTFALVSLFTNKFFGKEALG